MYLYWPPCSIHTCTSRRRPSWWQPVSLDRGGGGERSAITLSTHDASSDGFSDKAFFSARYDEVTKGAAYWVLVCLQAGKQRASSPDAMCHVRPIGPSRSSSPPPLGARKMQRNGYWGRGAACTVQNTRPIHITGSTRGRNAASMKAGEALNA